MMTKIFVTYDNHCDFSHVENILTTEAFAIDIPEQKLDIVHASQLHMELIHIPFIDNIHAEEVGDRRHLTFVKCDVLQSLATQGPTIQAQARYKRNGEFIWRDVVISTIELSVKELLRHFAADRVFRLTCRRDHANQQIEMLQPFIDKE